MRPAAGRALAGVAPGGPASAVPPRAAVRARSGGRESAARTAPRVLEIGGQIEYLSLGGRNCSRGAGPGLPFLPLCGPGTEGEEMATLVPASRPRGDAVLPPVPAPAVHGGEVFPGTRPRPPHGLHGAATSATSRTWHPMPRAATLARGCARLGRSAGHSLRSGGSGRAWRSATVPAWRTPEVDTDQPGVRSTKKGSPGSGLPDGSPRRASMASPAGPFRPATGP